MGDRDGEVEALNVAPYEVKQRSQHRLVQWNLSFFLCASLASTPSLVA